MHLSQGWILFGYNACRFVNKRYQEICREKFVSNIFSNIISEQYHFYYLLDFSSNLVIVNSVSIMYLDLIV